MCNDLLGIYVPSDYNVSVCEGIIAAKKAGFSAFFACWERGDDVEKWMKTAERQGMIVQSVHAPFGNSHRMWENGSAGDDHENELCECIKVCADHGIPLMVLHCIIGFDKHSPNEMGVSRYRRVAEYALKHNVRLAFENTEGEEYLSVIMERLSDYPNVGFCWDSGHELCYNRSKDMLALYGSRLFGTHLNDNMGVTGNSITGLDDAHLMPFDGIADWTDIMRRIASHNYQGILTFELTCLSKPGRNTHDRYAHLNCEAFYAEAYQKARRVVSLLP